ncbi:hypothetical protein [Halobacillus seohaensis]|uniref:Uncharacterized protein n=1 Tax=Halobacillus seohaensis TaxID=447421 RepID=A0ABW2ESQ1_9BACI
MCLYGNYKRVKVISQQSNTEVTVDACIADEIQSLNDRGVVTLGCCCGHGKAGSIVEYENGYGNWKAHTDPPMALLEHQSVDLARELEYTPFPYFYSDGANTGVWQMQLKTGSVTSEQCEEWHRMNNIPFKENQGLI